MSVPVPDDVLLDVQDLHVGYRTTTGGDAPAVDGVSLQVRAGLTRRVLGTAADGRRPPAIRRARVCRLGTHVLEAAVIADDGARVRAVALRLEGHRGAWRVTALEIG